MDYKLEMDIPSNIRSMTLKELVDWEGDRIKPTGSFNALQTANILNNILMKIGIKLDNEQMLFLLDDSKRLLCEASAGSGKTTVSQLRMIKYKMLYNIDGSDILAIAYNDHAASDMQKRHTALIEQIMSQRIQGVKLNDRIVCRTFHSNALAWITEYSTKCGITNKETIVITDANAEKFMNKAVDNAVKNYAKENDEDLSELEQSVKPTTVPALLAFLAYIEERMVSPTECEYLPQFKDIGLDMEIVVMAINKFNKLCEFNSMFTFSKILVKFYELLSNNEDIQKRISSAYKVLLIDEYQDMSPLMNAIIKLMLNEDTIFNAIGDGDQAIYSFKGTDGLNCIKFRDAYPTGKVVSMGANRRCKSNIIDIARNILSINTLRYPKEIYGVSEGGTVKKVGYKTAREEAEYLIAELKKIPVDKLWDCCIAYRNKESSLMISKMLLDARIPFVVKSGYEPYKDKLSITLYEVFAMLKQPTSRAYHISALYKVLPASRAQVLGLIKKAGEDLGAIHYLQYDWASLGRLGESCARCLTTLKECEDALKANAPMNTYFNKVYKLIELYYWNWMREQTKFPAELESNIVSDYNTDMSYKAFLEKYFEQVDLRNKFSETKLGVTLTTFHGLKGLEFENVYLTDLDNDIFPAYDRIVKECDGNEQAELEAKEECVRLFYIAVTRAKTNLTILYNEANPSSYMDLVRPKKLGEINKLVAEENPNIDDINLDIDGIDLELDAEPDDIANLTIHEREDINEISIEDFEIPDIDEQTVEVDANKSIDWNFSDKFVPIGKSTRDAVEEKKIDTQEANVADHTMYMYHEPSGSYYMVNKGEKIRNDIDFMSSDEVDKEVYDVGVQTGEEPFVILKKLKDKKENKVNKALGIFDLLSD